MHFRIGPKPKLVGILVTYEAFGEKPVFRELLDGSLHSAQTASLLDEHRLPIRLSFLLTHLGQLSDGSQNVFPCGAAAVSSQHFA